MTITQNLNNPNIQTVKTKVPVWSLYGYSKNDRKYIIIPQDIVLEVVEIYPNYGIDVIFQNKQVFLDFNEIEVVA